LAKSKGLVKIDNPVTSSSVSIWESQLMPWAAEILSELLYELTITHEFSTPSEDIKVDCDEIPAMIFLRGTNPTTSEIDILLRDLFPATEDDDGDLCLEGFNDGLDADLFPEALIREGIQDIVGDEGITLWEAFMEEARGNSEINQDFLLNTSVAFTLVSFDLNPEVWSFWILRRIIEAWSPTSLVVVLGLSHEGSPIEDELDHDLMYLVLESIQGAEGKFMAEEVDLIMPDDSAKWETNRTTINWNVTSFSDITFPQLLSWSGDQGLHLPLLLAPYKKR
jgi:hypothetical protein